MNEIDLVVPWVDGSDPKWQEERNRYLKYKNMNPGYFQDWGWMRYWFRCVEKNLPWIRNVFFITYGHVPEWLNLDHPKLKIVNHRDYIPEDFLPTYNCIPISMNVHSIEGLSETFIYAEDDIFFIGEQKPEDFFTEDGTPKDYLWLKPITEQFKSDFAHLVLSDMIVINKHFDMKQVLDNCGKSLYSECYPKAVTDDNHRYCTLKHVPGFKESHMAYAFRKSTFSELWELEEEELYRTCMSRFRTVNNVCTMLARDWQLASGSFSPCYQQGRYFTGTFSDKLDELILSEETNMICINESESQGYTRERAEEICSCFEKRFPEPSSYELK